MAPIADGQLRGEVGCFVLMDLINANVLWVKTLRIMRKIPNLPPELIAFLPYISYHLL